jgi:general secretion pathway protein G
MRKNKREIRGFTLIELLLVIILIAILAAMTIPRFVGRSEQARKAAARADVDVNLAIALDLYELDNGRYPTTEQGLEALQSPPGIPPEPRNWQGPYVKGASAFLDPWEKPYKYASPGRHNPESYDLSSAGPDGSEDTADDINNWQSESEQGE